MRISLSETTGADTDWPAGGTIFCSELLFQVPYAAHQAFGTSVRRPTDDAKRKSQLCIQRYGKLLAGGFSEAVFHGGEFRETTTAITQRAAQNSGSQS